MDESLAVTRLLNHLFAGPVDSLLGAIGVHPANPAAPIDNTFAVELCVVLAFIAFFALIRFSLSVEKPSAPQQFAEMLHELGNEYGGQIIGHGYERFQAFYSCIFIFVLTCNLLGLVPGIAAPTMSPVVPLGLAVSTWVYFNYHGFRAQGIGGYIKHHAGPIWVISWLLFPIEVISNLARIMSLTIRLWANMFAGDLVTLVSFSLIPLAVPAVFLGLHTLIYLGQAVAHEH